MRTHRSMPKINRIRHLAAAGALWITLAACAAPPLQLGPAASAGPVVCDTNCKVAWERAQLWIVKHSKMKVQTATDVLVQTYNPESMKSEYGFTATREPVSNGQYRITLAAYCADPLIGCNPRPEDVVAAFNYYVATGKDVLAEMSARFPAIH